MQKPLFRNLWESRSVIKFLFEILHFKLLFGWFSSNFTYTICSNSRSKKNVTWSRMKIIIQATYDRFTPEMYQDRNPINCAHKRIGHDRERILPRCTIYSTRSPISSSNHIFAMHRIVYRWTVILNMNTNNDRSSYESITRRTSIDGIWSFAACARTLENCNLIGMYGLTSNLKDPFCLVIQFDRNLNIHSFLLNCRKYCEGFG